MKVVLLGDGRTANGGAPMVLHNERLADPLDPFTQEIARYSAKTRKTVADHQEMARLEFFGGLYTDPPMDFPLPDKRTLGKTRPVVPAWNVIRCLQEGAKKTKRGQDVLRGITPYPSSVVIEYDGPTNPQAMYEDGSFALRKMVGVQRSRVMRTRPIFTDWFIRLEVEVDENVWNVEPLAECWKQAGWYCGLGEMRPVYGRFVATLEVL